MIRSVWSWLNGRKTALGLLAVALAELGRIAEQFSGETWTDGPDDYTKLVGYLVLIVGTLHKLVKGA